MNKRAPAILSKHPFLEFRPLFGNKSWDGAILGTIGVFGLALFLYTISLWSGAGSKIQYTPADVVYGEKLRAVQGNAQRAGFSSTPSATHSQIRLSEAYYDFGEVDPQQVLTRTFVIANAGQSPLVIRHAYTTCGCTLADFTATTIPPGKVALMTLQFDPAYHNMRGTTVRRGVVIESNDPDHPTQEIWIQAAIR